MKHDKYYVVCQLRDEAGKLLKEQKHSCLNMAEVFGLVEVCNRCGWTIRDIIEIKH